MIVILSLIVVLILILFLYNKDLFHRDTVITIVTSLPLGIFKDESKKQIVKEKEQINIKKDENNIKTGQVINEAPLVEVEANEDVEKEVIVYWTPNGKSYHMKNTCRTLARSKVILSGNTLECEKAICCEHCKIEEDKNKI